MDLVKVIIYLLGLSATIVIWSFNTFASLDRVKTIEEKLDSLATKHDIEVLREDIRELRR